MLAGHHVFFFVHHFSHVTVSIASTAHLKKRASTVHAFLQTEAHSGGPSPTEHSPSDPPLSVGSMSNDPITLDGPSDQCTRVPGARLGCVAPCLGPRVFAPGSVPSHLLLSCTSHLSEIFIFLIANTRLECFSWLKYSYSPNMHHKLALLSIQYIRKHSPGSKK